MTGIVLAAALGLASGGTARFEREVIPGAPGPARLELDVETLARARPDLADLRLYRADGSEVAYLVIAPRGEESERVAGRIAPVRATRKESGFEVDLGAARSARTLVVEGIQAPFLKRYRLEGSGDRARWVLLVGEGTLFDLPGERLSDREARFVAGSYRYLRLTWDDRSSARVGLPVRAWVELAGARAPLPSPRFAIPFERRPSVPRQSRFRLRLPGPGLPLAALLLEVPGGSPLHRQVAVTEPRLGPAGLEPRRLGEGTVRRAVRDGVIAARMALAITPPEGVALDLVVDDGDNAALPLAGVWGELTPRPWIYFEVSAVAPLTLAFGDADRAAPRYDLEARREAAAAASPPLATLGPVRDRAAATGGAVHGPPGPIEGAPIDRSHFRFRRRVAVATDGLQSLELDGAVLAHARGLDDVRLVTATGSQVPYLHERRDEPLVVAVTVTAAPAPADGSAAAGSGALSRYRVALPYRGLPGASLVLTTPARVFERTVTLSVVHEPAERRAQPWVETIATRTWRHADAEAEAPALTLDLPPRDADFVEVAIDEGDNQPLALGAARLLLPSRRIRFFATAGAPLELVYGNESLAAPRYDLALLASRYATEPAHEITSGPEQALAGEVSAAANQTGIFWGAIALSVVVLLGLVARLIRTRPEMPPGDAPRS